MAILNVKVGWLLDPFEQYCNLNGKPLTNGYLEVYLAGTNTKYITYQNFDGTVNPFQIKIPSDGRVSILAALEYHYDVYLYSENGNLIASRLNIVPTQEAGDISISGKETVLTSEDGTVDIIAQSIEGNVDKFDLSIADALTGKEDKIEWSWTDDGEVSGINSSAIYSKGGLSNVIHDTSLTGEGNYESPLGISNSYAENFVNTASFDEYKTSANDRFNEKEDNITWGYEGEYITTINGSALSAGSNYTAGDNIDITDEVISVTGKKNLKTDNTISITRTEEDVILGVNTDTLQTKLTNEQLSAISSVSSINTKLETEIINREAADDELDNKISEKQDILEFGYTDNKISSINGSAISAGNTYTAGSNIDITNNVISGRDWSDEINQKEDKLTFSYAEI